MSILPPHGGVEAPKYDERNHVRRELLLPIVAAIASRETQDVFQAYSIVDQADRIVDQILYKYPEFK